MKLTGPNSCGGIPGCEPDISGNSCFIITGWFNDVPDGGFNDGELRRISSTSIEVSFGRGLDL